MKSFESASETLTSEICSLRDCQAYGKVVQCGTCGEWYHYNGAIDMLGEDGFICLLCSEDLLYDTNMRDNNAEHT